MTVPVYRFPFSHQSNRFSMSSLRSLALLGMLAVAPTVLADDNPCIVMGIDFQDGGYYFQNSLSDSPFTFVQEFEGDLPE